MDRNDVIRPAIDVFLASLSARRAWIEILAYPDMIICTNVALRKESVDRNNRPHGQKYINSRRSPQGERG